MNTPHKPGVASIDEATDLLQPLLDENDGSNVNLKEANAEELEELDLKKEYSLAQLRRLVDDNKARKTFSYWIFTVTVVWMFLVLMIVVQCGRQSIRLPDGVLIALITTTTANVFGFFYVVVNYLFNKEKST
jgi:hypothetical protein